MSPKNSNKETALKFLNLVTSGEIDEAYKSCVGPGFRHHNPYYHGDAESLAKGMKESDKEFPNKLFELQRSVAEGDFVVTHSRVRLAPKELELAAVHIFRFKNDLIVELWDVAQEIPKNSHNKNGMF